MPTEPEAADVGVTIRWDDSADPPTVTFAETPRVGGWNWILAGTSTHALTAKTRFRDDFDGAYTAACPTCAQDCLWNAFDGEPLCDCTNKVES